MDVSAFVFSPRRAMEARGIGDEPNAKHRCSPRKSIGEQDKPKKSPRECYKPQVYASAVARGCVRADVPHWHPNQLRHNHGTEVRRQYGLESAGAAMGHSKMSATEIYAERDASLARRVASEIG